MIFFSSNLKCLREKKNCKQAEIADYLSVKPNTISNYEKGVSQPDFIVLELLKNFFEVSVDELLYLDMSQENRKSNFLNKEERDGAIVYLADRIEKLSAENAILKKEIEDLKCCQQSIQPNDYVDKENLIEEE